MAAPLMIASAAAPIVGGVIGQYASADDRRRARDAMSEAIGAVQNLQIPDIEKQKLVLERLSQQGLYTPEIEAEVAQQVSAMSGIQEDQGLRDIQRNVIEQLRMYGQTGLSAEDRAALNQARLESARDVKAQQDAVLQNMASRGMSGGGLELAARLQASQEGADRASQEGDRLMAMAQQRALQNIMASASQAGNLRSQDFDVASQKARAEDVINQFNTQLAAQRQSRNVEAKNTAQQRNLGEKQRVADTNVDIANREQQYNKELLQQQYQNALAKAGLLYKAKTDQAAQLSGQAAQTAAMWSQMGQSAGQAGSSYSGMQNANQQAALDRQTTLDAARINAAGRG